MRGCRHLRISQILTLSAGALLSALFLFFIGTGIVGSNVKVAHAQTPCYTYDSNYYYSPGQSFPVNLVTSSGQKETISIPAQNPPSILQAMEFEAANSDCALWYDDGFTSMTEAFTATGQSIYGSPWSTESWISPDSYTNGNAVYYDYLGYFDYYGLSDIGLGANSVSAEIADENAIINAVGSTKQFSVTAGGTGPSGFTATFGGPYGSLGAAATVSVPATNCVALGGTGPIKVVFARGKSWNSSISDLLYEAENTINNGYKVIDPYKTYFGSFSFYADLKPYDDSSLVPITLANAQSVATNKSIQSSCSGAFIPDQYIFFIDPTTFGQTGYGEPGYAYPGKGVSIVNLAEQDEMEAILSGWGLDDYHVIAAAAIHETGHAFAGLLDEYLYSQTGTLDNIASIGTDSTENCSSNPSRDFRGNDGHMYGGYLNVGCSYLLTSIPPGAKHPNFYYRASDDNIMTSGTGVSTVPKFDVISCGYIIAAIDRQALTQTNAATHWPQCLTLDTAGKSEIPPVASPPSVQSVTPAANVSTPNTFTVSGSGFTLTGNSIQLTPVTVSLNPSTSKEQTANTLDAFMDFIRSLFGQQAHAQTGSAIYEVDDIPSGNGSTLTLSVPTTTPDGTYMLTVSALNSTWTPTSYTIVVSGNGVGDPTTAINSSSATTPPPTTGSGNGVTATITYSCPSGYSLSGTSCYKPAQTTTVPATSYPAKVVCPIGSVELTTTQPVSCSNNAIISISCPGGGTIGGVYGNTCNVAAYTTTSPASTVSATVNYSCPSGYVVSGSSCIVPPPAPPSEAPPSNLSAKASVKGQISLSWTNNTTQGITSIHVDRAIYASSNPNFATVATLSGSTTSYVDIGLPPSQKYEYMLNYLFSDNTNSAFGTPVTVTTLSKPSTPSLKAAASGNVINLSWTDSDSTVITGYTLAETSPAVQVLVASITGTSYQATDLAPSTKYCYAVSASINPVNDSATSSQACATTGAVSVPLSVSLAGTGQGTVTCSGNACPSSVTSGTSVTLSEKASAGSVFTGWGGACSGTSSTCKLTPTASASVTTTFNDATAPSVPAGLSGTALSSSAVSLSWSPSTDNVAVTGYKIFQGGVQIGTSAVPSYQDPNLAANTAYSYAVSAFDAAGNASSQSGSITMTTLKPVSSTVISSNDYVSPPPATTTLPVTPPVPPIPATAAYSCQHVGLGVYLLSQSTERCYSQNLFPGAQPPRPQGGCPANLVLSTDLNMCFNSNQLPTAATLAGLASVPPTVTYSCPSGYTLNSTDDTCSPQVSAVNGFSWDTANVWNAITSWFGSLW